MDTGLYVALSSQMALQKRLETIANNVANSNTTGFHAAHTRFSEVLDGIGANAPSFVSQGSTYATGARGGVEKTGNALDFAINGNAWFGAQTEAGPIVTRDGRFQMSSEGALLTLEGHAVLDPGGAPILLNPAGGHITVGEDGAIWQDGQQVAGLGIFSYEPTANFRRFGSAGILAESALQPVVGEPGVSVLQGHLEKSNVNPVAEMSKLIQLHRAFENTTALMRDSEGALEEAIRALGSG